NARVSSEPFQAHASHRKNPALSARSACTFPQHCPGRRRPDHRSRRQEFRQRIDPSEGRGAAPKAFGATTGLAFGKLQTGSLPTVTQPFHQDNLPFVIEEPFLVGSLFLRSTGFG